MNRRDATNEIKSRVSCLDYLKPSKGRLYCCPFCQSGMHGGAGSDGALEYFKDSNRFKCHACGEHGTVIDLYMQGRGIDSFAEAVDEMAAGLGITIDRPRRSTAAEDFDDLDAPIPWDGPINDGDPPRAYPFKGKERDAQEALEAPKADYTEYLRGAVKALEASPEAQAYITGRGISMDTARQCCLGFDPAWVSPTVVKRMEAEGKKWRPEPKPVIIIPSTTAHYVARDIRPDLDEKARKYSKMNEGEPGIMGEPVLYIEAVERVFVVEGAFDALSIIEAGEQAIALNSTSNADKLLKRLEKRPTQATLILALDNDEAGRKATERLRMGLQRLNISFVTADITGSHKDPNEFLQADREGFEQALERAAHDTTARPDSVALYLKGGKMAEDIRRRQEIGVKPTGFSNLDAATDGGLRPGLFLFGAGSSLGKTTFCSQLADGLAENGADVLYFSLEQSALEMVTKSLSRETAYIDMKRAVSSKWIADGHRPPIVQEAEERYLAKVGDRISIIEAGFNADTKYITDYVQRYYRQTGKRPVTIIDYLQVVRNGEVARAKNTGTREVIEEVIKQLVLLKRELDLTIIAIVSLNRASYLQHFDFESIKETGLAEYSGDVVWGLELRCLDEEVFSKDKSINEKRERIKAAKAEIPRRVKLVSLKHRGQQAIYDCLFDYFPQYDLFVPVADVVPMKRKKV